MHDIDLYIIDSRKIRDICNMKLSELKPGQAAEIKSVGGEGALRQHFLDMGVIPGAHVSMTKMAPMGDPMEMRIHGYSLTLRLADAENIEIDGVHEHAHHGRRENVKHAAKKYGKQAGAYTQEDEHPGLGEEGKYHVKGSAEPLPEDTKLTFGLVGNQNSGKTTLFNQLTGANQHVGNFPGVTVDRKDGVIRGQKNTAITDLPGIYSMSP